MNEFLIVLRIIVGSRGYIILNEQFLIRICFVAFVATIILYSGDSIKNDFEQKQKELLRNHDEFVAKKVALKAEFIQILKARVALSNNLSILTYEIIKRTELGLINKQLEEDRKLYDNVLRLIESTWTVEQRLVPAYQKALVKSTIDFVPDLLTTPEYYIRITATESEEI